MNQMLESLEKLPVTHRTTIAKAVISYLQQYYLDQGSESLSNSTSVESDTMISTLKVQQVTVSGTALVVDAAVVADFMAQVAYPARPNPIALQLYYTNIF